MRTALCAIVALLFAVPVTAQVPVVNPNTIEFNASVDHDALSNGTAVLTKYTVSILAAAQPTGTVWKVIDLGKPTPVSGKITFTGLAASLADMNPGSYVAVVKAEGPGGVSASVASDPFQVAIRAPGVPGKPVLK